MKLDMLSLLTALSACVFLARDAFAIPVPNAAASYHHVKRMENFEPILDWAVEAGSSSAHALTDGDNAVHAGASLTSAQDPHSLAQPIRGYGMQHASNDGPYFRTHVESPHTLAHPYGEPDVTVTRPHMHVVSTSMVGHDHSFALEGGRGNPGGRQRQDVATVRSNDERLVRQPGDEHVAGPSTKPISTIEELKTLTNDKLLEEGERLLGEAFARGQPSSKAPNALRISEADVLLKAWLLEVFRRRIDQVTPSEKEPFRHVRWRFTDDPRPMNKRTAQYRSKIGWPTSKSPNPKETPVAFGPFDRSNIINPLLGFDIGAYRYHVIQLNKSHNIGLDTSNSKAIHIFFSVRGEPSWGVISFGDLEAEAAPSRGNIPDALVNQ